MPYSIRHMTRFTYDSEISESVMEARMQPRSDSAQRCLHFGLSTLPGSHVLMYQDHQGNVVHHFNIPGRHSWLTVTAEAIVECAPMPEPPPSLGPGAWEELDGLSASGECWEMLNASPFARPTGRLEALAREIGLARGDDPLSTLRRLTAEIYARFEYSPHATRVDSPIDEALESRRGVCQDFAHVMIALVRQLAIPCRYVSGYLFQESGAALRSSNGATHAWVEALMPSLGWVGFDPTNNMIAADRHIRVAVGRDYSDVPPTRGVYKGISSARTELAVSVSVGSALAPGGDAAPFVPWMSRQASGPLSDSDSASQQQQ